MNMKVPKFIKKTEYRIWANVGTGQLRDVVFITNKPRCYYSDTRDKRYKITNAMPLPGHAVPNYIGFQTPSSGHARQTI